MGSMLSVLPAVKFNALFPDDDRLDPWDAEAPPELWPDDTDADVWTVTNTDEDDTAAEAPALSLADLVDAQAAAYRVWPTAAGAMIADVLDALALRIRLTDSVTPAEFSARVAVLDAEARETWEQVGYEAGLASCRCHDHTPGSSFGHQA